MRILAQEPVLLINFMKDIQLMSYNESTIESNPDTPTPPRAKRAHEFDAINARLAALDMKISREFRINPKEEVACSVLAHKTYSFLPEIITNSRIRTCFFSPLLNSHEGEMLQISHLLDREMKLQILESSDIPPYAKLELKEDKLLLKVKNIHIQLIMVKTQFGYQWFNKLISLHATKDKLYHQACIARLYEYFIEAIGQLNNIDQANYQSDFLKEHFLSFISYCCSEASKYLAVARLFKEIPRLKETLRFSHLHQRTEAEAVEYVMIYSMPHNDFMGKILIFEEKAIVLKTESENECVSIVVEVENGMVCETAICIEIEVGEKNFKIQNNLYKGDKTYAKLTKELLVYLIESAEEIRRVCLEFSLKREVIGSTNLGLNNLFVAGLVLKLFNSFVYSEGRYTNRRIEEYIHQKEADKVYLLVLGWQDKSVLYEMHPNTLVLKSEDDIQISYLDRDFSIKRPKLSDLDRDLIIKSRHVTLKREFLDSLKVEDYKIIFLGIVAEDSSLKLGIKITAEGKLHKSYNLKLRDLISTYADVQLEYENGVSAFTQPISQDFLSFSNLKESDIFSTETFLSKISVFIGFHQEIKRVKDRQEKNPGSPKITLSAQ